MNEIILLTITTSLGSFDIELYQKEAPITANNFVEYVEQNFYENTLFHRVIPGFVIQGGGFEIGCLLKKPIHQLKMKQIMVLKMINILCLWRELRI